MRGLANYVNLCKTLVKAKLAYKNIVSVPYPFRINVAVTYLCNLRCKMCDIWKIYRESPDLAREEMTPSDYGLLFESFSSHLFWLGLTGGEPFLKKDLLDIICLASSKLRRLHILELTTNGFSSQAIEKGVTEILEDTKLPFLTVGISIDGPRPLHDHIRGMKGSWDHALATYKKLCEISGSYPNFFPHISYTISRHNAGNFVEFLKALSMERMEISLNSVSVAIENTGHLYHNLKNPDLYKGSLVHGVNADMRFLITKINKQIYKSANKGVIEMGRQFFKKMFLVSAMDFLNNPNKMVIPCSALIGSCFIDPFGYVYPCSIYGKKLGRITKVGFHRIWHSQLAYKVRESIKQGKCPNCWSPCEAEPSFLLYLPKSLLPVLAG